MTTFSRHSGAPQIKLYSFWRSSASYRVRMALHYKKIPFEYVPVNILKGEQNKKEFLQKNPMGYVPALEIDGHIFTESVAILGLLDDLFPKKPLYPSEPKMKAYVSSIAQHIACGIQPLTNLNVLEKVSEDMDERKRWAQHFLSKGFDALEKMMAPMKNSEKKFGPFVSGSSFSVADACIVAQVYVLKRFEVDLSKYPHISQINGTCLEQDFVKKSVPEVQVDAPSV